ncbi:MAG: tetratricopeptide repeat protein [Syntrophales bacterium]|jgi:protein O-mannosyl-transferase
MANRIKTEYWVLAICAVLSLTTLGVFWQVSSHTFISFDDGDYVAKNLYVQDGLTWSGIVWAFSGSHAHNWHPLTWLSHMLDCQLFGLNAGMHHLANVLFHIANSILLFLVLYRMTKGLWQSAFAAGLFALHPLHVESVAWVSERKDVLSTLFWMLTMGAYVYYVERPGYKRYIFVLLFFILGLMSKPMLVTLPFVLLLLDFWPLKRFHMLQADASVNVAIPQPVQRGKKKSRHQRRDTPQRKMTMEPRALWPQIWPLLREKIPLVAITMVLCVVTIYAQHRVVRPMALYPMDCRIANALISYVSYIGKMFWPVKLSIFYPYGLATLFSWQAAAAILVLLFATYLSVRAAGRFPYVIVGWLWYVGTLIPVIGLVQVGLQSMADRYTYVPLIGVSIMVAWGAPELLRRWHYRKFALTTGAVAVLSSLAVLTYVQVGYWRNNVILYEHAIEVTSQNAWAQNNLGYAFELQGKKDEAIAHFQKAISISNEADAHYNLGTVLASQGKLDEAIYQFRESIRISPDYAKAYNNLGNALLYQGRLDEAITSYQEAIRLDPDYALARENFKNALAMQKKFR